MLNQDGHVQYIKLNGRFDLENRVSDPMLRLDPLHGKDKAEWENEDV